MNNETKAPLTDLGMLDAAQLGESTPTGPDHDLQPGAPINDNHRHRSRHPSRSQRSPYDLRGVQTRDLTLRPVIVRLNTIDCSVEVVMGGRAALKFAEDLITEVRRPIRHD